MSYITWEYYNSLYNQVAEEEFERLNKRASGVLDVHTRMRVKDFVASYDDTIATNFQKQVNEQIKMTVCELINAISIQDASGMGTGIASVSNDGYSESYKITTAAEKDAQLLSISRSGLSGTGLVGVL